MKKTLLFLVSSALIMLGLSSCEGPMGPQGPRGPQGPAGPGSVVTVVDIDIPADKWIYTDISETSENPGNNCFYFNVPDMQDVITKDIFEGGLIKMYRVMNDEYGNPYQFELPYVSHQEYWSIYDDEEQVYEVGFYTETVDYRFGIGSMTIFYTASDFEYEVDYDIAPVGMKFRCVIMY